MIEWWWLFPALFVGVIVGFGLLAIMTRSGPDEL